MLLGLAAAAAVGFLVLSTSTPGEFGLQLAHHHAARVPKWGNLDGDRHWLAENITSCRVVVLVVRHCEKEG